jgi:hypothetical protein
VAAACAQHGTALVVGTTGLSDSEQRAVREAAGAVPIVSAPNMSVGVNVLLRVVADVARRLGDGYDVEIVETHHRFKKDAPSGTALALAEAAASALGRDLETDAVHGRQGLVGERKTREIGIHAVRAGDVVGDHTVIFGGLGERVEITHKASSRETFARGAILTGILGIGFMPWKLLADYGTYIFGWLGGYSGFLGPIAGIFIADYWLVRRGRLALAELYSADGLYGLWNRRALVALLAGVGVALVGLVLPPLRWIYDYAWFVGFGAAFGVYTLLMRGTPLVDLQDVPDAPPGPPAA